MTRGSVLSLSRRAVPSPPEEGVEVRANLNASTPNIARMYDYLLGGKDTYAADREAAERALLKAPVVSRLAQANRAFVDHAAGLLAEANAGRPLTPRSREEIAEICGGLEMPDPYPAHPPLAPFAAVPLIGCLGRKPE